MSKDRAITRERGLQFRQEFVASVARGWMDLIHRRVRVVFFISIVQQTTTSSHLRITKKARQVNHWEEKDGTNVSRGDVLGAHAGIEIPAEMEFMHEGSASKKPGTLQTSMDGALSKKTPT